MTGKSSIFFLLLSIQQPKWRRNSTFIQMLRRMSQCKFPRPQKRMSNNEVVECCQSLEWINQSVVKIKVQNFNSKSKQYAFDHYLTFFCVKLYPILYYCHSNITHKTQQWTEQLSTEKNTCFKGKTSNYNKDFIKWHLFLFYFFILKNSPYSLSL